MRPNQLADLAKTVGTKETLKAVKNHKVEKVFLAKDADRHIVLPIIEACKESQTEVEEVETMAELGKACGIQVPAAAAAIIHNN